MLTFVTCKHGPHDKQTIMNYSLMKIIQIRPIHFYMLEAVNVYI